jgi:C4-dicarboxylate transporter, DctM subunit
VETVVLFGLAFALILLDVPVAFALAGSALLVIWIYDLAPLDTFPSIVYATVSKYTLLAVPFFIVAGFLMERSGIAQRLVSFANLIVGGVRGGMAYVSIIVAVLFAGISGSGTADTAALGAILTPAMREAGYKKEFIAALIACGGSLGIIVPPSLAYVLYGAISGASIGKLFIAGIIPGVLVAVGLGVASYFAVRRLPLRELQVKRTPRVFARHGVEAFWGLMAPVIILGGIYGGVFTPTEAAGVVVVYSLLVGLLIYRELKPAAMRSFFTDAALVTCMAMTIVIGASLFSWVITTLGLGGQLADLVNSLNTGSLGVVAVLCVILLIAGMFLDPVSITFVFIPLFLPTLQQYHVDLVWFGVLYSLTMAVGQVHPPVGVNLYISASLADARLSGAVLAVLPMIATEIVVLVMLLLVPGVALWLPNALGMT